MIDEDDNEINNFRLTLLDIVTIKSNIMILDNMLREVTKGIINEKWMTSCKKVSYKSVLRDIFDLYLVKIQKHIWVE